MQGKIEVMTKDKDDNKQALGEQAGMITNLSSQLEQVHQEYLDRQDWGTPRLL